MTPSLFPSKTPPPLPPVRSRAIQPAPEPPPARQYQRAFTLTEPLQKVRVGEIAYIRCRVMEPGPDVFGHNGAWVQPIGKDNQPTDHPDRIIAVQEAALVPLVEVMEQVRRQLQLGV